MNIHKTKMQIQKVMKKKVLIMSAAAALFAMQPVHAQYPQLTDEAAGKIKNMKAEWETKAN